MSEKDEPEASKHQKPVSLAPLDPDEAVADRRRDATE